VADAGAVAETVAVTAFAGPFYPSSWAAPQPRRLKVEFAAGVTVTFVSVGPPGCWPGLTVIARATSVVRHGR
jgi:hypothetical protein